MPSARDISGQKFGKLKAIKPTKERKKGRIVWLCQCDCGNEHLVVGTELTSGNTQSCGCGSSRHTIGKRTSTHGLRFTRQYNIWTMMKRRCNNLKDKAYGGKGIRVTWDSFESFWADMKDTYADDLTIDRIDPNGNYCKENCRWISRADQNRNKSNLRYVTYNGETLPLKTMCDKYGLKYKTVYYQYVYANKPIEWCIENSNNKK